MNRDLGADQKECDLQWCRTRVVGVGVRACMGLRSRGNSVVVSVVALFVRVLICASRDAMDVRWVCDVGRVRAVSWSNMENGMEAVAGPPEPNPSSCLAAGLAADAEKFNLVFDDCTCHWIHLDFSRTQQHPGVLVFYTTLSIPAPYSALLT
jgi:hypothetical protein